MMYRMALQTFIWKLGWTPPKAQRLEAFKWCDRLQNWIDAFHNHAVAYWIKDIALEEEFTGNILDTFDDAGSDEDDNIITIPTLTSSPDDAERTLICLPSQFSADTLDSSFMHNFTKQERKLWEGQANDALQGLQLSLCQKSVLYWTALWLQTTKKGKSCPQKEIQDADANARH